MSRARFSESDVPSFEHAPSVVLVAGDVEFFVEEAAGKAAARLSEGDAEVLRFEEDAPAEAVSDALLNRSLFSSRRLVQFDVTRLLGSESPGNLVDLAVEAWERGTPAGRREAFRRTRALISALGLPAGSPTEELAGDAARKTRRRPQQEILAAILSELPEERSSPAVLKDAIRLLLQRGNDGTIALLTATAPPAGVDLLEEISAKGLVLTASVGEDADPALARLARALAKEREVSLEPDAISRLLLQTDSDPRLFSAELGKLLQWAGPGGRVRAADVRENVADDSSEDVYAFYDAIGHRDAGDALSRLERLFSKTRAVRSGDREMEKDEESWPVIFLGMLTGEVRRMLLIRALMEETSSGPDASTNFNTFKARVLPRLSEPIAPFGRSPFQNKGGQISPFLWFKAASRAAHYTTPELARALARAADVDVRLKSSIPPLDALSVYVAELIGRELKPGYYLDRDGRIDLSGRVALVTGGSRGIGRAVARILARAGARVAVDFVRNVRAAESLVEEVRSAGGEAMALGGDVSQAREARGLVESTVAAWGRLDILVNNAGIWEEDRAGEGNLAVWERTLAINLRGAFLVTDSAVPHLEKTRGAILFVSSTAGQRGEAGHSAYAATKGGLISYTKSLAAELGPRGIRVNCVAPGWVETDLTRDALADPGRRRDIEASIPLGRVGQPADIAGPVLFLVSDLARHVQGEVLNVNGGSVLIG